MRLSMRQVVVTAILLAGAFGAPARGSAQGVTTGGVRGTVLSAEGTPIGAATVTITSPTTGATRVVSTSTTGRYATTGLETGSYRVRVTAIGFGPQVTEQVTVTLSQLARADFVLTATAVTLQDIVTAAATASADFAPTRTGAQASVSDSLVARLPTRNRQLQDFAKASPQVGVNPGRPGDLSVAGQNSRFNAIQVDGSTQNDRFGLGNTGELGGQADGRGISLEAVKEYQIVVSPYHVTQGGFTGGLINAVTKSGTNSLRTSAFYTYRDESLATSDPIIADAPFTTRQFGGSIGGPLIRDRLHLFVAGEFVRSTRPAGGPYLGQVGLSGANAMRVDAATIDQFNAALRQYGIEGGNGAAETNRNPVTSLVGRLDWRLGDNSRLVLRQIYNDQKADDFSRSASRFALTSNRFERSEQVSSTTAQLFHTFPGGSTNELQVGYIRQRFARAFDRNGPQISIYNIPSPTVAGQTVTLIAGPDSSSHVNQLDQDFLEFRNDYTFALGGDPRHQITVGTRSDLYKVRNAFIQNLYGSWGFASIDSLLAGNANRYSVGIPLGDPVARFRTANVAFYAQDQWAATPDLTLTLGLRAEAPLFLDTPAYKAEVERDFGRRTDEVPSNFTFNPRLGVNWDVGGRRTTQVRGGVGLFAGTPPYVWLSNLFTNNGAVGVGQMRCDGQSGRPKAPTFTRDEATTAPQECHGAGLVGSSNIGTVNTVDPSYRQPQVLRATLGLDQQLPGGFVGTVDLLYTKAFNEPYMVNLELPDPVGTDAAGRVMYGQVNPNGGTTIANRHGGVYAGGAYDLRNTSAGYSYSLSAGLSKRFDRALEAQVFYTYGRAYSAQDFTSSVARSNFLNGRATALNQFDDRADPSAFDHPHRLSASATWTAPWKRLKTDVSVIFNVQSGNTYTYVYQSQNVGGVTTGDLNADGVTGNDPVFLPRNVSDMAFQEYSGSVNGSAARTITAVEQAAALEEILKSTPCLDRQRGGIMGRNSCLNPAFTTMDVSVRQALPTVRGHALTLQADVYNFLNFVNPAWGRFRQNTTYSTANLFQHRGQTDDGRPLVRLDPNLANPEYRFPKSLSSTAFWQAQISLRYTY